MWKSYSGHAGVVQADSYRKDFPVFREKSKELHLHRRNKNPAGNCRATCSSVSSLKHPQWPYLGATWLLCQGKKIITMKISTRGTFLNKEVQHSKPRVAHLIQLICCQQLCNGESRKLIATSHSWCDGCYPNKYNKQVKVAGTSTRVQEVAEALPGHSLWHLPGDSQFCHVSANLL